MKTWRRARRLEGGDDERRVGEVFDGERRDVVGRDEPALLVVDGPDAAEHEPLGGDPRLGVEGEPVGTLAGDRPQRHAAEAARRRRLGGVQVGMRVEPEHGEVAGRARGGMADRCERGAAVAADRERPVGDTRRGARPCARAPAGACCTAAPRCRATRPPRRRPRRRWSRSSEGRRGWRRRRRHGSWRGRRRIPARAGPPRTLRACLKYRARGGLSGRSDGTELRVRRTRLCAGGRVRPRRAIPRATRPCDSDRRVSISRRWRPGSIRRP